MNLMTILWIKRHQISLENECNSIIIFEKYLVSAPDSFYVDMLMISFVLSENFVILARCPYSDNKMFCADYAFLDVFYSNYCYFRTLKFLPQHHF